MSNDLLNIYVEQLRDGRTENLKLQCLPEFLEVNEKDLAFSSPIEIEGEAYLAEDSLVLNVDIATKAVIPCVICNEPVVVDIKLLNLYHVESLADIKTGIYNFQEVIRENIILETPHFAECHEGKCPQREGIDKFLKKPNLAEKEAVDEGYHPFAGL